MAENSKIEWTHHTFNGWIGCAKVSKACDFCYAETSTPARVLRANGVETWGAHGTLHRTSEANWRQPVKWNKRAEAEGKRYRVFCASLADVFDNQAKPEWRADLFALIRATPHLDWLLLTKRPQNIAKMLPPDWGEGYPNVWLGTTVENQQEADRRIPHLLAVPARVRFLSCEPLLGPVDLGRVKGEGRAPFITYHDALEGACHDGEYYYVDDPRSGPRLDWIIVGGESGPKARPMHPDWARSIRDQCAAAGVAFHFKQWGEWARCGDWYAEHPVSLPLLTSIGHAWTDRPELVGPHAEWLARVGKKAAGRLLDGVEHNGLPVVGGAA